MTIEFQKRTFIRIISFSIAIIISLFVYMANTFNTARNYRLKLEYSYLRALDDLSEYINNISATLNKTVYVGTPELLNLLSTNLWRESNGAKISLSQLPVGTLNLDETYKFLSQVGDYSFNISKKVSDGISLTDEERKNIKILTEFSTNLRDQIMILQDGVRSGYINFEKVNSMSSSDKVSSVSIGDGFEDFQQMFSSYPKLIYDGPFSDHILDKNPEKLVGLDEVSKEIAKQKASLVSGIDINKLKDDTDEYGKMPSYCFTTDEVSVSITKAGGLVSYMINSRAVQDINISDEDAKNKANEYIKMLDIPNLEETYHETSNNIMTINYAHKENGIIYYTDLIKVSVALDSGDIVGFDARGYIVNNKSRKTPDTKVTLEKAKSIISPLLNIEKSRLTVIPSSNIEEVLTYEFLCTTEDGQKVLVYVNANTGKEEQILILIIGENGIFTI